MKNCILLVGVTLPVLEGQINRIFADDESAQLAELLFAQGTGFVAAIVRDAKALPPSNTARGEKEAKRSSKSKSKR